MEENDEESNSTFVWVQDSVHGRQVWKMKKVTRDSSPVEGEKGEIEEAVKKFIRDPPTEEQILAHKAVKKCLSGLQQTAIEKLEQVLEEKGGRLLLCDDPELSDLKHLITFMMSDFANEGSDRMRILKNHSIPLLRLCKTDFDSRGDFEFRWPNGKLKRRGGMCYHQPDNSWIRVGLKCSGLYDNGNDDWLAMNGNPNEWAVGFHGSSLEGNVGISESRSFYTNSKRQRHRNDKDVNSVSNTKGQLCGRGAYFANKIDIPANRYAEDMEGEMCVFQVRLKPSEVRIPDGNLNYMIVSDKQYARPYGICLKDTSTETAKRDSCRAS